METTGGRAEAVDARNTAIATAAAIAAVAAAARGGRPPHRAAPRLPPPPAARPASAAEALPAMAQPFRRLPSGRDRAAATVPVTDSCLPPRSERRRVLTSTASGKLSAARRRGARRASARLGPLRPGSDSLAPRPRPRPWPRRRRCGAKRSPERPRARRG